MFIDCTRSDSNLSAFQPPWTPLFSALPLLLPKKNNDYGAVGKLQKCNQSHDTEPVARFCATTDLNSRYAAIALISDPELGSIPSAFQSA